MSRGRRQRACAASSRRKTSRSSASSFPDQHGILRGKTLIAGEAIASLESGCSITTTMLAKDTSHRTVFPVFTSGGGFGMKEMEGAADVLMVAGPHHVPRAAMGAGHGLGAVRPLFRRRPARAVRDAQLYRKVLEQARRPRLRFRRRPRGRIPHLQARRRAYARPRMPASPARRRR